MSKKKALEAEKPNISWPSAKNPIKWCLKAKPVVIIFAWNECQFQKHLFATRSVMDSFKDVLLTFYSLKGEKIQQNSKKHMKVYLKHSIVKYEK